ALKRDLDNATDPNDPSFNEPKARVAALEKEYTDAKQGAVALALARDRGIKQAKINDLTTQIDSKKGERERIKEERDQYQKLIASSVGGTLNIQAMRDALKPKRENLERVNTHLEQVRLTEKLDGRASSRGEPDKIPNYNQNKKIAMSSAGGLISF